MEDLENKETFQLKSSPYFQEPYEQAMTNKIQDKQRMTVSSQQSKVSADEKLRLFHSQHQLNANTRTTKNRRTQTEPWNIRTKHQKQTHDTEATTFKINQNTNFRKIQENCLY